MIERYPRPDKITVINDPNSLFSAWLKSLNGAPNSSEATDQFISCMLVAHSRGELAGSGVLTASNIINLMTSRYGFEKTERFEHNGYIVEDNKISRVILPSGKIVKFTPTEFAVFLILMRHPNTVLEYNKFANLVWGYSGSKDNLKTYVCYIRSKIGDTERIPEERHIQTIFDRGYIFNPPNTNN